MELDSIFGWSNMYTRWLRMDLALGGMTVGFIMCNLGPTTATFNSEFDSFDAAVRVLEIMN